MRSESSETQSFVINSLLFKNILYDMINLIISGFLLRYDRNLVQ